MLSYQFVSITTRIPGDLPTDGSLEALAFSPLQGVHNKPTAKDIADYIEKNKMGSTIVVYNKTTGWQFAPEDAFRQNISIQQESRWLNRNLIAMPKFQQSDELDQDLLYCKNDNILWGSVNLASNNNKLISESAAINF